MVYTNVNNCEHKLPCGVCKLTGQMCPKYSFTLTPDWTVRPEYGPIWNDSNYPDIPTKLDPIWEYSPIWKSPYSIKTSDLDVKVTVDSDTCTPDLDVKVTVDSDTCEYLKNNETLYRR